MTTKRKTTPRKTALGNPVALATAANAANTALEKRAQRKAVAKANRTTSEKAFDMKKREQNRKIWLGVLATGVVLVGGKLVLDKVKRDKTINNLGNDTPEGIAASLSGRFYVAMVRTNGFINDWLGDGTDVDALYQLAQEMGEQNITLAMVAKPYNDLYKRDLIKDLNEIDANAKGKFDDIYKTAKDGKAAIAGGLKQYGYVKANKSATLYKSVADGFLESGFGGDFPRGSIITIAGGTYVGEYTGQSTESYYKFRTIFKNNSNDYTFYVKKDLVQINTIAPVQSQYKSSAQSSEFLKNY